ncbi:tripartite motif-containing protein 5-like isoform X1 [Cervus canadensis]|uniref:tripartite motif-containing protein 5-like isoform X1 n=1 Tax=Cervus canadensis TaxID=1574408 RepID=UPI001C9E4CB1|nr:tripartite motif-containing protein 5-like isoform X1 [Cervus canadensis]
MASGILMNIQEEVTCPVCLELLTEPLSLDCGHTFCQACITVNNKESIIGQEGNRSCPVCRVSFEPGNLRPNRQVANIVQRLQEVKGNQEEEQKRNLCAHHGEKLQLFCEKDRKVICWLCERSQAHRGHETFLLEEVAPKYQETLQSCLQRLKAEKQEAEKLEIEVREEMSTWKTQIQNEMQSVQENFTRLRQILDSEEVKELKKLKDELEVILKELAESENDLVKEKLLVTNLISDVEHHLQGSTMELLQDVNDIMKRSESLALKKPKTFAKEQRRVFRAPDLREILRVFNELTDVQRYWVEVTLTSPRGANVVISPDQRQVRYASNHQDFNTGLNHNYENFGVLGFPVITSGRHYWEVDVSEKRAWILGVCGENCEDTMAFSFETSQNYQNVYSECQPLSFSLTNVYSGYRPKNGRRKNVYSGYQPINGSSQNVYSRYQPKNGYWVIGLKHDSVYNAFDESSSSHPVILTLSLSVSPHRVGVFLDYEARTVLFLNVTNHGFPIYKFSSCSFPQRTVPYFHPMQCEAPMTLCSPSC